MRRWIWIALLFVSVMRAQTPAPTPAIDAAAQQKDEDEQAALHTSGIQSGIDDAQKDADDADAAIAPLLKKLTPVRRAAYQRAAAAMQHFIHVQVTGDYLFMGGYGSGGLYPNEEHAAFENLVAGVLKKPPAAPSTAAAKTADDALNKVYGQLLQAAAQIAPLPRDSQPFSSIMPDGLRAEQRAWLAYRDAFVAFGRTLHPELPPAAWIVPLTASRTQDLQTFYNGNATDYAEAAQKYNNWKTRAIASEALQTDNRRQEVAEVLDHLTPAQAAAWQRAQAALEVFAAAHAASLPHSAPSFRSTHLTELYAELYAIQYNKTHGFTPDAAKAADNFIKNDAALNAAYQADLGTTCLFRPAAGHPESEHRTIEGLRDEQRAWIKLRDAWVSFLETLYPEQTRQALSDMFTGSRSFELQMLHQYCERTGQAPREQ